MNPLIPVFHDVGPSIRSLQRAIRIHYKVRPKIMPRLWRVKTKEWFGRGKRKVLVEVIKTVASFERPDGAIAKLHYTRGWKSV